MKPTYHSTFIPLPMNRIILRSSLLFTGLLFFISSPVLPAAENANPPPSPTPTQWDKVVKSSSQPGFIGIATSSHEDTAWMDTPEVCRNGRVEKTIVPALEMMKKDPKRCFTMECALHLMEFLEAHPERRDEVSARDAPPELSLIHI